MIPTPMVLRRDSNHGPSNGLVKMSAFLFSVLMNSRRSTFSSTKSWMKWYQISICFDFKCCIGFFNRLMVLVLSHKMHMVSWVIPLSWRSFFIYRSWAQQLPIAMYSALAVDRDTKFCFLLIHDTKLLPR